MSMEPRKLKCDYKGCKEELIEKEFGSGFPEWGGLHGLQLNGRPILIGRGFTGWGEVVGRLKDGQAIVVCPSHLLSILELLDSGSL
jgi:hypothetical protein